MFYANYYIDAFLYQILVNIQLNFGERNSHKWMYHVRISINKVEFVSVVQKRNLYVT